MIASLREGRIVERASNHRIGARQGFVAGGKEKQNDANSKVNHKCEALITPRKTTSMFDLCLSAFSVSMLLLVYKEMQKGEQQHEKFIFLFSIQKERRDMCWRGKSKKKKKKIASKSIFCIFWRQGRTMPGPPSTSTFVRYVAFVYHFVSR